jgi:hypothetical protein
MPRMTLVRILELVLPRPAKGGARLVENLMTISP